MFSDEQMQRFQQLLTSLQNPEMRRAKAMELAQQQVPPPADEFFAGLQAASQMPQMQMPQGFTGPQGGQQAPQPQQPPPPPQQQMAMVPPQQFTGQPGLPPGVTPGINPMVQNPTNPQAMIPLAQLIPGA